MFSNILIYFVIIPLLMLAGFALCRNDKQIRAVAVIGSTILIAMSVWLLVDYLALRQAGETARDAFHRFMGMVWAVEYLPCGGC